MATTPHTQNNKSASTGHRAHGQTVSPALVGLVGVGIAVLTLALVLIVMQYFTVSVRKQQVERIERGTEVMRADYYERTVKWDATLQNVGWVDSGQQVVRIPIESAMKKVAAEYVKGQ